MPVPTEHRSPLKVVPPIAAADPPGGPPFERWGAFPPPPGAVAPRSRRFRVLSAGLRP